MIVFIDSILDSSSTLAFEKFFKSLVNLDFYNEGGRIVVSIGDCGILMQKSSDASSILARPPFNFPEVNIWN